VTISELRISGDFVVASALDQRGLYGGLGGSPPLIVWHSKDKIAGTPDLIPTGESGLPDFADSNGLTVSAFASPTFAINPTTKTIFAADISMGSFGTVAENDAGIFVTTPPDLEGTACGGATEGKSKNAACFPIAFSGFSSTFNVTAGSGIQILQVASATDSAQSFFMAFLARPLSTGNPFIDMLQCKEPVTGSSSCTPLGGVAAGTATNPIAGFSLTAPAGGSNVFVAYAQGGPTSQTLNVVKCTVGFPSSPSCGTPTQVTTFTPVVTIPGQAFSPSFTPDIAGDSSDLFLSFDGCGRGSEPFTTPFKSHECARSQINVFVSTDGATSWSPYTLPTLTGIQYLPSVTVDSATGNFFLSYLSTGKDATFQSFVPTVAVIPASLGPATIIPLTAKPIDPSAGFSGGDSIWSAPTGSIFNGIGYEGVDSIVQGNWGANVNLPKETNVVLRFTSQ
jgi:hypothetical protein